MPAISRETARCAPHLNKVGLRKTPYGFAALVAIGICTVLWLRTNGAVDPKEGPAERLGASPTETDSSAVEPLPLHRPFHRIEHATTDTPRSLSQPSPGSRPEDAVDSPWDAPNWFFDTEVLPGTTLAEFDPSTLDAASMMEAGLRLMELEDKYARSLRESDPSVQARLVDEAEASYAFGFGAAVLRYETAQSPKFLVCNAVEAEPILLLRELFSAMTWSDTYQQGMKDQLAKQHGAQAVWIEPIGDGSSFEIFLDGVRNGTGWFHVPGSP